MATARRPISVAHQPEEHRSETALGILSATGGDRRSVQAPEGRSGSAPPLSSERESNRSAHLRGVSGLLPVGDAAGPAAQAGGRPNEPVGAGGISGPSNGGCAFSEDRGTGA